MNWSKRTNPVTRYQCQPARMSVEPTGMAGRVQVNTFFHRMSEDCPPVDFPVSFTVFEKDLPFVKEDPNFLVAMRKGRPVTLKAGGRYTPGWYELNTLERVRYYIAMMKVGY